MARKVAFILFVLFLHILCLSTAYDNLNAKGSQKRFTLVIDAGHGGKDTGALGDISKEKDINLSVALKFGHYVEQNCPDVRVVYTRKMDIFIELYQRANIANREKADLFISIHTNATAKGHTAKGFSSYTLGDGRSHATQTNLEVAKRENDVILLEKDYKQHYVGYDPNSPESNIMFEFIHDQNMSNSVELAKYIQRHVCATAGRPDRGVHQDNFAVLRLTSMPACLLELGFITTPAEEQLLNDNNCRDTIAYGIYQGFLQYKNKHDDSIVVPYKDTSDSRPAIPNIVPDNYQPSPRPTTPNTKTEQRTSPPAQSNKQTAVASAPSEALSDISDDNAPIFKIQLFVISRQLRSDDSHFKGLTNCSFYEENNKYKYTYGSSTNYNEIYQLRKQILDLFPEAFIIAFKNGERINVNAALKEFLDHTKK